MPFWRRSPTPAGAAFAGQHVLITGGSEGLGLALARQLAAGGARVSIVARTQAKLDAAAAEVLEAAAAAAAAAAGGDGRQQQQQQQQQQQRRQQQQPSSSSSGRVVYAHSADVTNYAQVQGAVAAAEAQLGPLDVLICCAGAAELGYFHELPLDAFRRALDLNYGGALHAAKAAADGMLRRNSGRICFVASTMSLLGLIGYSAYAPSKFALRGLAECLRNELQGTNVRVSITYPADIDTPGYARENRTKPWETAKLSEGLLQSADAVAATVLRGLAAQGGAEAGPSSRFALPNSAFLVGLLQTITLGLVPRRPLAMLWEALLGALSPLICAVVAAEHDGVARRGARQRYARLWGDGNGDGSSKRE